VALLKSQEWKMETYRTPTVWHPVKKDQFNYNVISESYLTTTGGNHMQEVTVKREQLLEKLKENREAHREVFEISLEGYRKAVIEHLERLLADAREGKRIEHNVRMPVPQDQTPEYDQAIAMLEMSVDDEIELTSQEFACYVMDRWGWKRQFTASNKSYFDSVYVTEGELPQKYQRALSDD
jgi:hypothetical protein